MQTRAVCASSFINDIKLRSKNSVRRNSPSWKAEEVIYAAVEANKGFLTNYLRYNVGMPACLYMTGWHASMASRENRNSGRVTAPQQPCSLHLILIT